MRITLIVGTIGRTTELSRLLESLQRQTFRDFNVIIVDQTRDGQIASALRPFEGVLNVTRIESKPGLSPALNAGLEHAAGNIVAFPDDDCWYPPNLLEQIVQTFDQHPEWDGVSVICKDERGAAAGIRWSKRPGRLTRFNVWFRNMSTGIFLRKSATARIGPFDESFGVGPGLLLASHDTDYLLRAVALGLHVEYLTDIHVGHPQMIPGTDERSRHKNYQYALGAGMLMRKHGLPIWFVGIGIAFPLFRTFAAAATLQGKSAGLGWTNAKGRFEGWRLR